MIRAIAPSYGALCALVLCLAACGGSDDSANNSGSTPTAPQAASDAAVQGMTVGSKDTFTADPTVPRPSTTPCEVVLFKGQEFKDFSSKRFDYAPPAACAGPWAKVVLEADFSSTMGRQYDRSAHISINGVNLYTGTTQEPSADVAPTWHVQRDVTEYSQVLRNAAVGYVDLDNLFDNTYTGLLTGSARLKFYPASATEPALPAAQVVWGFSAGANGRPIQISSGNPLAKRTLELPRNMVRVYLDVIPQGQSGEEFWFSCVTDRLKTILDSCGGTALRELVVQIDGQTVGVAPVYPWIFTGGMNPALWRSIPSVQAFNLLPYRLDLSPFAGLLNDGKSHEFSFSVPGSTSYFAVLGVLLGYTDAASTVVSGGVISNTAADAAKVGVDDQIKGNNSSEATGSLSMGAQRSYSTSGYIVSSKGREELSTSYSMSFSNLQTYTESTQNYTQNTRVSTTSTAQLGGVTHTVQRNYSYPLVVDLKVDADGKYEWKTDIGFTEALLRQDSKGGSFASSVQSEVSTYSYVPLKPEGKLRRAAHNYFYTDTAGGCFKRKVTSEQLALTSAVDAAQCGGAGSLARMPYSTSPQGGWVGGALGW
ncbi:peptide-N4-asparagine amidase [Roseateles sp. BYS180W]|uniref:Peptide-N4-asparagine amidase n=1 Tax=Roseateles rivi TaxID=3299028 RepID=A0ABW7FR01_9BURK